MQRHNGLDATTTADSRINDRLIKCIQHKTFNNSKLLNHVAPSVELMMQRWVIWYK